MIQIPPAVGSSGQFIESVVVTSSQNRHVMALGDALTTAYGPVTTSGGVLVAISNPSTAVTFTNAATTAVNVVNTVTVLSASSGLVQISGTPTVLTASSGFLVRSLSSGTVTLSSNPTVVLSSPTSLSSGIVSPSSNWTVVSTATTITSGTITLSSAIAISSGTFTLSSTPLVIVASSGGTIPVTLSTVFSLSSTPTVTASATTITSGTITLSSNPTVVSASSGFVQAWHPTISAAGFGPVTSSYGLLVAQPSFLTSSKVIIATSVAAISPSAGILWGLSAFTTSVLSTTSAAAFMRLYDQTTGNATSSTNSGLAGACMLLRLNTSANTLGDALPNDRFPYPQGIKFATACSFDIVLLATSTAANAIGGWVTAQYTT